MTSTGKPLRAALYARYSTNKQSKESTADQFRKVRELALREGWTVVAEFADPEITGGTADRPEYQAMLAAARRHEFDVIAAEEIKRLWRENAEQWRSIKELLDLGLHVVTASGGIDSRREGFLMMAAMMGAAAEIERTETAYRTRRGLEGKALARKPTGGKAYGYRPAVLPDGSKALVIVDAEADIVRRIFREYASGKSPRDIAAGLNADGIPSPGASWRRNGMARGKRSDGKWQSTAIHGHAARATGILNNVRYCGRVEWGRTRWSRGHADSLKRRVTPQATPFHSYTDESLRIVPQDLWDKVKARQASIHLASATVRSAVARAAGRPVRHLFSGLFACATCGGSFVRVNSRDYGCSTHKNGGPAACPNSAAVPAAKLEHDVADAIRAELLSPEAVEFVVSEVRRGLREARKVKPAAPVTDQALAAKDREIEELRGLMRSGVLSPAVAQAALTRATEERAALIAGREQKDSRSVDRVLRLIPDVASRFRRMMDRLPRTDLPAGELVQARAIVHAMIGGRATVERDASGRILARLKLDGRPLLGAAHPSLSNLVAGAGFEPATFGL